MRQRSGMSPEGALLSRRDVAGPQSWTYVMSALCPSRCCYVGFTINWWVAITIFGAGLVLHLFGFVRRDRIRRRNRHARCARDAAWASVPHCP
jgi:hypothetical protein